MCHCRVTSRCVHSMHSIERAIRVSLSRDIEMRDIEMRDTRVILKPPPPPASSSNCLALGQEGRG